MNNRRGSRLKGRNSRGRNPARRIRCRKVDISIHRREESSLPKARDMRTAPCPRTISRATVGPPPYVSDIEVVVPDGPDVPLIEGDYPPADESADPPPEETTFPPPPPLPPPPGQETVGDATASDADISAEAEQRHGYYWWQDTCYYRYPSGAYAPVDSRYCY